LRSNSSKKPRSGGDRWERARLEARAGGVGGLLLSQFLTLYTTPVIYIYLSRLGDWIRPAGKRARSSFQASRKWPNAANG
jgi:hypothetical protein